MQLSATDPTAQRLLVADDVLPAIARAYLDSPAAVAPLRFQATALVERHTSVSLRYESSADGYVRLAYSHAPFGRMEIDGRSVPFSRDALGAIVVQAPRGAHELRWSVGISRLRGWMIGLSGLALLLVSASLFRSRRARQRER